MTPSELKSARETLGLSQAQLALALRMRGETAGRTVRRWEAGEMPVPGSVGLLLDIAEQIPKVRSILIEAAHGR